MSVTVHRTLAELEALLPEIAAAPSESGPLELIVRRPAVDLRETVSEAGLDREVGLVGDDWATREEAPDPDCQVTLKSARTARAVAVDVSRWPLSGDQLYVDLDLSAENLPVGTHLRVGEAVLEVTAVPHLGCKKYANRFGVDALKFVNGRERRHLRLRGCYTRIVEPGRVRTGDAVSVLR